MPNFLHSRLLLAGVTLSLLLLLSIYGSSPSVPSVNAQTADITTGLVGYWKFDETSGTTAADSAGTNTGTLINGPTWTTGKIGGALSFDGVNNYVTLGTTGLPNANASQSISFWYKVSSNPNSTQDLLTFQSTGGGSAVQIEFRNGNIGAGQWGGTMLVSVVPPTAGIWHHFVYTFNGTTHQLYINTSLLNSSTLTAQTGIVGQAFVGTYSSLAEFFSGQLDDVRIYNRALTAADIQALYNLGSGPPDTTPPSVPTNLTASAVSSSQINLAWTASTDNVGVTGYKIYRCTGTACTPTLLTTLGNVTSYSDIGLSASTVYTYKVSALDAANNESAQSSSVSATTQAPPPPDTTPPSVPAGLTATTVSSSQINLTWTASTDNVGVTGYRVERCQGVGCTTFSQIATPSTNSYNDTGLTANTTYRYQVRATDGVGNLSGYSSIVSGTTQSAPAGTALGNLAASMAPGTWAELVTNGYTASLLDPGGGGSSGHHIFEFTDDMQWDNVTHEVYFIGGEHNQYGWTQPDLSTRMIKYKESTNSWSILPNFGIVIGHAYDHSALNPTLGQFYHRSYNSNYVQVFDIATQQWTGQLPIIAPASRWLQIAGGLDYFPDRNGLVFVEEGGAFYYSFVTQQWTEIGPISAGPYHNYSEYSPGHKVMIYGGGNDSASVYRMDAAGNVVRMKDGPIVLGISHTVITVDPVSGDYLVMDANNGNLYQYNPMTDVWTFLSVTNPVFQAARGAAIVATPVVNYGVTMFLTWDFDQSKVWLYKHSASTPPPPDTVPPTVPTNLTATAVSSSQINLTWTASTDNVAVTGYRVERCQGVGCATFTQAATLSTNSYNNTGLAANTTYTYQVRATDAAGNLSGYSSNASATTQPAPAVFDFSLFSGGNVSVTPGQSISNSISASLVSGAAQSVLFAVSGLPSGVTSSFSSASCTPACSTTLTLATLTSTSLGTYTITVTGTSGSIVHTTSFTLTVTSSTASDFTTRCAATGVVRCYGFDDIIDLTTGHPRTLTNPVDSTTSRMYGPSGGTAQCTGGKCWELDTNTKVTGASSLRFEIPSNTGADTSGSFRLNFADDFSQQFGAGEEFYVQYRERFSPDMLHIFQGANGWKQSIIGLGDRVNSPIAYSCTAEEMVFQQGARVTTVSTYGMVGFYHGCGFWETMQFYDGTQVRLQTLGPPYCYYPDDPRGGCFYYSPNEWMTFKVHIKIAGWGTVPGNRVQIWAARENQPSVLISDSQISHPNGFPIHQTDATSKYGKIWLLPYNTNKSSAETHPTAYVWYDDLIISRNDIADPGGVPHPDTTPPTVSLAAPASGSTVSGSSVTVSATASDNVGVSGVQFLLDGVNLQAEDTTSPYAILWNTTTVANGSHTLTARARDAAGNTAASTSVSITVSNGPLVGDLNGDGTVNSLDWSIMNSKWFSNDPLADLNKDGIVNSLDFSIMNSNWGKTR